MVFTTQAAQVRESAPYRFDGRASRVEFSADIIAAARGDVPAHTRLNKFMEAFAVGTANVPGLAMKDMAPYTAEAAGVAPIWDAIGKPAPFNRANPFVVPDFGSASNLIDPTRTEGVEPTAATLVTGGGTLTPTAVMGHIDLTAEVADQRAASPIMSAAMWAEINRSYAEALEARAVALLTAIASPTTITLTTGATGATLVNAARAAVVALAHTRGGPAMRTAFTHPALHTALATAADSAGRTLLPDIADGRGDGVTLVGRPWRASPALTAASWLLDPDRVHGWATPPRDLLLERTKVSTVVLGVLGYSAEWVSRVGSVRKIAYAAS